MDSLIRLWMNTPDGKEKRLANNASGLPEFIGYADISDENALRGSGDAVWQIQKVTYDGSNFALVQSYANGTNKYDKKWTLKSTYTYITS